jgi:hypothetical protein
VPTSRSLLTAARGQRSDVVRGRSIRSALRFRDLGPQGSVQADLGLLLPVPELRLSPLLRTGGSHCSQLVLDLALEFLVLRGAVPVAASFHH